MGLYIGVRLGVKILVNNKKIGRKSNIMIRLSVEQAIDTLISVFNMAKKAVAELGTGEHLNAKLLEISKGRMCLKGTRTKTNIDYAPKEVRESYLYFKGEIEKLPTFTNDDGKVLRCSAYCNKEVEKNTKK